MFVLVVKIAVMVEASEYWTYSGLASVIEPEEEQFGVLVGQTQLGQHIPEPVENPHDELSCRRFSCRSGGVGWCGVGLVGGLEAAMM